jgi:mRNA deadenylase 3'-5' endonuclease subunit Ccr4
MQWNVMAAQWSDKSKYPYAKPESLAWDHRFPRIMSEIEQVRPDIMCLQEVDNFESSWAKELVARGYETTYHKKAGREDGNAICFQSAKCASLLLVLLSLDCDLSI